MEIERNEIQDFKGNENNFEIELKNKTEIKDEEEEEGKEKINE